MKRLLSILATLAMVFSFGLAVGEEVPTLNQAAEQELGNVLFHGAPGHGDPVMMTKTGYTTISGIEAARVSKDIGIELSEIRFTGGSGSAKGSAAGGVTAVDRSTMTLDEVLGARGSDLP